MLTLQTPRHVLNLTPKTEITTNCKQRHQFQNFKMLFLSQIMDMLKHYMNVLKA